MARPSAEKVAQHAFDLGLVDERQLQETWATFGTRDVPVDDFLQLLVRRGFMTNYQVERLMRAEQTGFFFGDYKVLYLIGAGTFARVYRAVCQKSGQVVALKVLRHRYSENPVQYGLFAREGTVGCSLRHHNIVPIYEVYSHGKTHFLVMEFVEGRNLREFVKVRGKVEPAEATKLMSDIVAGLHYAFENGITHRDLKMSNVLISSRREAKLVDFGLAAMDETLANNDLADMPNTRTIDYAALERVTNVRRDDTRSDIYFLGCIYYHMLTGMAPLSETRERLKRLSRQRFLNVTPIRKLYSDLPDSVALVVNKAMMLNPEHRYQSPSAMLSDLAIATQRIAEGPVTVGDRADNSVPVAGGAILANHEPDLGEYPAEEHHSVMVVESNSKMQDVFRDGLKRAGYRVLLTSDPTRALGRFHQDAATADCIIFNAQQLGQPALDMFNRFGKDPRTDAVPAMLLLDEEQHQWKGKAVTAEHRVVLPMPITMKKLRLALAQLVD